MPAARRPLRSWPDAAIAAVDRLPGAAWLAYLIATLVTVGLFIGQRLVEGIDINPVTVGYTALTFLPLAAMHYANRAAARALDDFRPALGRLEPEYESLRRRLTTMPFWPAIIAALIGAGVLVIGQFTAGGLWGMRPEYSTGTNVATATMQLILNMSFAAFVFHTVVQVMVIVHIHRDASAIELWNTPPHNAFSNLTLLLAIAIVVPYSLVEILSALNSQLTVVELTVYAVAMGLSIAVFVLPLSGVRSRLLRERTREFDDTSRAFAVAAGQLRAAVESGDAASAPALKDALTGLALDQDRLRKVSTWPWTADTFRGFVTTLGIPLVLWFLTTFLGRVLF
jgi:hypothetical protein